MPSKEHIALVAEAIIENPPVETVTDDEIILDWSPTAKAAISTIRAAQNEHIEAEIDAYIENFRTMSRINGVHVTRALATLKRRLIDESPLGKKE